MFYMGIALIHRIHRPTAGLPSLSPSRPSPVARLPEADETLSSHPDLLRDVGRTAVPRALPRGTVRSAGTNEAISFLKGEERQVGG